MVAIYGLAGVPLFVGCFVALCGGMCEQRRSEDDAVAI